MTPEIESAVRAAAETIELSGIAHCDRATALSRMTAIITRHITPAVDKLIAEVAKEGHRQWRHWESLAEKYQAEVAELKAEADKYRKRWEAVEMQFCKHCSHGCCPPDVVCEKCFAKLQAEVAGLEKFIRARTGPISALQAEAAELKAENERLKDGMAEGERIRKEASIRVSGHEGITYTGLTTEIFQLRQQLTALKQRAESAEAARAELKAENGLYTRTMERQLNWLDEARAEARQLRERVGAVAEALDNDAKLHGEALCGTSDLQREYASGKLAALTTAAIRLRAALKPSQKEVP